jgi:hypothetical protein
MSLLKCLLIGAVTLAATVLQPLVSGTTAHAVFNFAQTRLQLFCFGAHRRGGRGTSHAYFCRMQTTSRTEDREADLHPRGERKLRADAECWLVLASRLEQLEATLFFTDC